MKKFLSMALVIVLAVTMLTACGTASMGEIEKDPTVVVAKIGDQSVYAYEMIYLMRMGATKEQALEQLYNIKAMVMKAAENNIKLEDADLKTVDDQLKQMKDQYGADKFKEMLAQYKITEAQYKEICKMSQLATKLNEKVKDLKLFTEATDEEISGYYDANFLKAKHILFTTVDDSQKPISEEEKAKKKAKADETLAKIKAGEAFESFADLSEDPGSKESPDGYIFLASKNFKADSEELSYFYQYGVQTMVEPFEVATSKLKVGEVSEVVESDYGYHIIKRLDLREKQEDFDKYKELIGGVLNNVKYSEVIKSWVASYKTKTVKKYYDGLVVKSLQEEQQASGAAQQGAAQQGEAAQGEAQQGEAQQGEAAQGEAQTK